MAEHDLNFFDADVDVDAGMDFFFSNMFAEDGDQDETSATISPRSYRMRAKQEMRRVRQNDSLRDVIKTPPKPGEEIHVVSANKYSFWTWAPVMIDWIGWTQEFYCSTWTTNAVSTRDFFRIWDEGKIKGDAGFILGTYFKRREPVVYTALADGLTKRGGWIKALETHAKVMLLNNPTTGDYLTIEGSANLTANPRIEQITIINDERLWAFHRDWMLEVKTLKKKLPWD